jgi:hypothetical protein
VIPAIEYPGRLILAFGLILSMTAAVAPAADLGGTVTDQETGLLLAGATALIIQPAEGLDGVEVRLVTGLDGRFLWQGLAGGEYEIEFSADGYDPRTVNMTLGLDDLTDLVIPLSLAAFVMEDLVVVGGTADIEKDLQTGYVKLDRGTLSEIPGIIEDDPLRALQILPGVQAASDISSGLYIRGGGPDQTLVLMEGVTVYNPTHAFGFFSTFNNDAVSDLALFKGAYPAAYGGRLGAVLDVDMVQDTAPEFSGKAGISLISGRLFLEGRAGPDHWWAAGRRSFLEPLLEAVSTPEEPIPSWYFYDTNAGFTSYRWGGVTRLLFYKGRDQVAVDADVNTRVDLGWGNTVALLRHERFLSDNLEGRVTLSHSRYDSRTEAEILATGFEAVNKLKDTSLAARLDWRAAQAHRVVSGLSYSWYDLNYRQEFNLSPGLDYGSQPGELAAFLEDSWFADDLSTVRGGVRYRHVTEGQLNLWEPRLSARRQVRPDLSLKIGGGIYHQTLQLVSTEGFSSGDFYVPIDETADPGRSWQVVVGADWQAAQRTDISLEVYNTDLEDLVALDNNVPVDQNSLAADDIFVTEGKGYARGVELFLRHNRDSWSGWVGYTLGWTRRTFAELNGGQSFVPKYDRRHDLNLLLSRQSGSWKLTAAFRFATGQAFTPAAARYQLADPGTGMVDDDGQILSGARNSGRLLPYHRLDFSARRPIGLFGLKGEFVAEIFNLYNRRNEWFVQYDTEEDVTEASVVRMLPLIPSVGVNFEF